MGSGLCHVVLVATLVLEGRGAHARALNLQEQDSWACASPGLHHHMPSVVL